MRHAPPGYECPFCLYASGGSNEYVTQAEVVQRTEKTLTFISPKWWPNNPGHVLVMPIRHFESLYDLPDSLAAPLLTATRQAALAMKHAYRCAGTSVRQHNEPAGNQDVWHYHQHVFPRYASDTLYESDGRLVSQDEMRTFAVRLREAYAQLRFLT